MNTINTTTSGNTAILKNVPNQNTPLNIDREGESWKTRTFSHPERTIRIGTSCSGIAAETQAIKQLGLKHEIVFAGDIDRNVKKSFFANYDITEDRWHNDLFTFDATPYKGKIDLFMAGICCQPFSIAGKKEGIEDELRGGLFRAFCRVIRECEPKIFIMENVKNMLSVHGGEDWRIIFNALNELGYELHYQVLNACDYDCPQNRERLFVIGFQQHTDFLFPRPVKLTKNLNSLLEPNVPVEIPLEGFEGAGIRKLTPRESLRVQGFEDDFKMVVPDSVIYKQAGNSISVNVLKAIFTQMDITKYGA